MKSLPALVLALLLPLSNLEAGPVKKIVKAVPKVLKKIEKTVSANATPKPTAQKTNEEIAKPLETPLNTPVNKGIADKIFSNIVIPLGKGPLLLLPIIDSSKDLGLNYGIMPIMAIRNEKEKRIGSVIAPSFNYNRYLKSTLAYRHYFFPDDKQLWVVRGSYSSVVQRELFLRYFNPEFVGTKFRVNAEARHWVNGKASFYGVGPDTAKEDRSTFALNMTGEEFTLSLPLPKDFYFDFTHSWYRYKVSEGPVTTIPQLDQMYPQYYNTTSQYKDFMTQKFAVIYDTTDHPTLPKKGIYAEASVASAIEGFASDYSYNTYTAHAKSYFNFKGEGNYVTAVNAKFQHLKGDNVPFYILPVLGESTGLRSAGDGRFVDRGKLVFNIEERFTVSKLPILDLFSEIELTPFIDAGTVFSQCGDIRSDEMKFGYGGSFRIVLRPQVVATFDLAFGREGTNLIIQVGYPF